MKPFDLERALAGDPVITRDGRKVLEIHKLSSNLEYAIIAVIEGERLATGHQLDGIYKKNCERDDDLFMAPKTKKRWVNLYYNKSTQEIECGNLYNSHSAALNTTNGEKHLGYLDTIEIEVPA